MEKDNFNQKCLNKLHLIPKGMVTTYFEIANSLNSKGYRAVGNAMANNPNPIFTPCHRVVRSDGTLGGYSYSLGIKTKIELLKEEGLLIHNNKIINFKSKLFKFNSTS